MNAPSEETQDDPRLPVMIAHRDAPEERPRKNDCVFDELLPDGGMVLYHSCQQQIMTLNPTAALVWEYCDGAHSLAMIASEVREVFPDARDIEDDILTLLRELIDRKMIIDDYL